MVYLLLLDTTKEAAVGAVSKLPEAGPQAPADYRGAEAGVRERARRGSNNPHLHRRNFKVWVEKPTRPDKRSAHRHQDLCPLIPEFGTATPDRNRVGRDCNLFGRRLKRQFGGRHHYDIPDYLLKLVDGLIGPGSHRNILVIGDATGVKGH